MLLLQAQTRYGNNWKAISMLLPGRTNRAVKNLFVGNLKWGARLPEIRNRWAAGIKPNTLKKHARQQFCSVGCASCLLLSTVMTSCYWTWKVAGSPAAGSPADIKLLLLLPCLIGIWR